MSNDSISQANADLQETKHTIQYGQSEFLQTDQFRQFQK